MWYLDAKGKTSCIVQKPRNPTSCHHSPPTVDRTRSRSAHRSGRPVGDQRSVEVKVWSPPWQKYSFGCEMCEQANKHFRHCVSEQLARIYCLQPKLRVWKGFLFETIWTWTCPYFLGMFCPKPPDHVVAATIALHNTWLRMIAVQCSSEKTSSRLELTQDTIRIHKIPHLDGHNAHQDWNKNHAHENWKQFYHVHPEIQSLLSKVERSVLCPHNCTLTARTMLCIAIDPDFVAILATATGCTW